jgi:hypothetical protein
MTMSDLVDPTSHTDGTRDALTRRMRIAAVGLVLLLPACGLSSSLSSDSGRCAFLEGRKFESVDLQGDCGLGPDGAGSCHWMVRFDEVEGATEFVYRYSDIGETGQARCTITPQTDISIGTDTDYAGHYNTTTGHLTWDGIVFTLSSQD